MKSVFIINANALADQLNILKNHISGQHGQRDQVKITCVYVPHMFYSKRLLQWFAGPRRQDEPVFTAALRGRRAEGRMFRTHFAENDAWAVNSNERILSRLR